MKKDFKKWNDLKTSLDLWVKIPHFHEKEIWWVYVGLNIGTESNGVGNLYLRPIIIVRKYNRHSFIGIPLTSSSIRNKFRMSIGIIANKHATANLSQLKYFDSRRLHTKLYAINEDTFQALMGKVSEIIFADLHKLSSYEDGALAGHNVYEKYSKK